MNQRFIAAIACYAALAVLAGFTLTGEIRIGTWVILGAFALKSWLVVLKNRAD